MDKKVLHSRKRYRRSRKPVIVLTSVVLVAAFLVILGVSLLLRQLLPVGGDGAESSSGVSSSQSSAVSEPSQASSGEESSEESQASSLQSSEGEAPSSEASSEEPVSSIQQSSSSGEGATVDGYFSDACFIGDSRTEGLRLYGAAPSATFYSAEGLAVNTVFTQPAVTVDGKKVSVVDALKKHSFEKIYIMFGVNELGWPVDSFIRSYGSFVKEVKKLQPEAKIYVQNIFPVTANKSNQSDIYNNTNIKIFNKKIQAMAKEQGVGFVDLYSKLGDESGNLPKGVSPDGVHLDRAYCEKWVQFLMENGE